MPLAGPRSSGYENPRDVLAAQEEMLEHVNIDCKHDVPFVAGMSKDGDTLFIDKVAYPKLEKLGYLRALIVHEMVEHCLMKYCGMKYKPAHAIATGAEESTVRDDGIDLTTYNHNYDKIIREVAARGTFDDVPKELDTTPYVDEGDEAEIEHHGSDEPYGGKAIMGRSYG